MPVESRLLVCFKFVYQTQVQAAWDGVLGLEDIHQALEGAPLIGNPALQAESKSGGASIQSFRVIKLTSPPPMPLSWARFS